MGKRKWLLQLSPDQEQIALRVVPYVFRNSSTLNLETGRAMYVLIEKYKNNKYGLTKLQLQVVTQLLPDTKWAEIDSLF